MIITKQWLNEFVDLSNISTANMCNALNSIGLEVDSVNDITIAKGVVVGFVKKCVKHPNADKLNVCQVDIGNKVVQIVCGASNIKAKQYVPVATVGTTLGKDFMIKKAKLRGEDSHGMICSSTEIGLVKLDDGIMELDNSIGELILGKNLNRYSLLNDTIIDIELTANRGDCLSINGVAKDLAAYFNLAIKEFDFTINECRKTISGILDVNCSSDVHTNLLYSVINTKNLNLSLLYNLRVAIVSEIKNTQIETLIEYSTHTTGILLNAYTKNTAQKNDQIQLEVYNDKNGFTNVDGNIHLSKVGIKSGKIIENDNIIVLEASYINPNKLSQRVFKTKQKTGDIYYRSSRGSNPNLEYGMDYITNILSLENATIYKGQINLQTYIKHRTICVNINKIDNIIGQKIDRLKIENILISLGFIIKKSTDQDMTLMIPNTRHDIVNTADVTEEIIRMIGIDKIIAKPLKIIEVNNINKISKDINKKNKLRSLAIANNFFETITYIFSSKDLLMKYGFDIVKPSLDILNPINSELNTFRTTMLLNLLFAVSSNAKQGFKSIALFENGIVFDKNTKEIKKLSFVFSGKLEEESLQNSSKVVNIDLFTFAQKITNIIGKFTLEKSDNINNEFFHPYQCGNIIQNQKTIGVLSKIHPNIANDLDIDDNTFVAQIDFDMLNDDLIQASNISKFQSSIKDLSIVVPKNIEFKIIKNLINDLNLKNLVQYNLVDIYSDKELGENESLTIRFVLQSNEKTLQEDDINSIMNTIIEKLDKKLNIKLR
jgi:phenylalanyl-tRNA synthetase beta chain